MPTFLIVEFPGEGGVGIVPLSWTIGKGTCKWPPFKGSQRFEKAVKLNEKPDSSWSNHRIRILGRADNYERARTLLRRAEDTSDLQTDDEDVNPKKRKKVSTRRYISSDEETDSEDETDLMRMPPPSSPLRPLGQVSPAPNCSVSRPSTSGSSSNLATTPNISPETRHSSSGPASNLLTPTPVTTALTSNVPSSSSNWAACSSRTITGGPGLVNAKDTLIIAMLTQMKTEVKEIKEQLQTNNNLISLLQQGGENFEDIPDEIQLPVTTSEELINTDQRMATDKALERQMIRKMSSVGGHTLRSAIKRILREIMTNDVAKAVNWTGQGGKIAWKDLLFRKVVERSIRKNGSTTLASDADIQKEVVRYLKGAPDREGGRRARGDQRLVVQAPEA